MGRSEVNGHLENYGSCQQARRSPSLHVAHWVSSTHGLLRSELWPCGPIVGRVSTPQKLLPMEELLERQPGGQQANWVEEALCAWMPPDQPTAVPSQKRGQVTHETLLPHPKIDSCGLSSEATGYPA